MSEELPPNPGNIFQFIDFELSWRLEKRYPNWFTLFKILEKPRFNSQVLGKLLGMNHQQINDWDKRNVLGGHRKAQLGWRKFSALDVLGFALLKEVKQLGLPLGVFQDAHRPIKASLPKIIWNAIPYITAGKETFVGSDLRGGIVWPFFRRKGGLLVEFPFPNKSGARFVIRIDEIVRKILKELDFPKMVVKISENGKMGFWQEDSGRLGLEKLKFVGLA